MRLLHFSLAVMVTAGCLFAAKADDWPQWLGPRRDGVWRESGILEKFPPGGPKIKWRVPIAAGYSGVAVAGDRLILMDRQLGEGAKVQNEANIPHRPSAAIPGNERITCFNAHTGEQLWQHVYDCPYTVSYPSGPRCTPIIAEGKVYTLGTEGHLLCLNLLDGKVIWSKDFARDFGAKTPLWGHAAHPLLDGQRLICMVGGEGSAVVAFDKETGKEIWRNLTAVEIGYCPPMIYEVAGRRQLIVWHGSGVNGLDPDSGQVLWGHAFRTYQNMAISTPRLIGDKLYITGYPTTAFLFRLKAEAPGFEIVWKGDRKTGFFSCFATPFELDGYLYGGDKGGRLACIKVDTGERQWESLAWCGGRSRNSGGDLFLTRVGDTDRFFMFTELGDLYIVRLTPKGLEEIDKVHLLEPTGVGFGKDVVWNAPAYAHRCVYVRNDKELICVSLAAE
jgi:outer membrane protein assembly factor BamB